MTTIVVPTYNERENIELLARRVFAAVDRDQTELLIVDDNSPDGTAAAAKRLASELPVRCMVRKHERGLATAVIAGMREARGELIVVMDADLSHPPEMIPAMLAAMRQSYEAAKRPGNKTAPSGAADDADLNSGFKAAPNTQSPVQMVIGSRFVPGGKVDLHWPLHRRLNSLFGRLLARPLTPVKDMMAGFFCVRKGDLRLDSLRPIGYKIALELIVRHGWTRIVEIPITFSDRAAGRTKLTPAEQMRYLRHLWRLYAHVLLRRGRGGS